jgi:Dyp-type peroxidase family
MQSKESNPHAGHSKDHASGECPYKPGMAESATAKSIHPREAIDANRLWELPSTATKQYDFCVITDILPEKLEELRAILAKIQSQTLNSMKGKENLYSIIDWKRIESIHYARFFIIEAYETFGSGPKLVFCTNYDGPLGSNSTSRKQAQSRHISEIVRVAELGLDAIYRCCRGYSGLNEIATYFNAHSVVAPTFYVGSIGRSRDQIIAEENLRFKIQQLINSIYRENPKLDPESVRSAIQKNAAISSLKVPKFEAQPNGKWKVYLIVALLILGLAALIGLAGFVLMGYFPKMIAWTIAAGTPVLFILALVATLRYKEKTDPQFEPKYGSRDREHDATVSADDNHFLQNEISHIVDLKPGIFRKVMIRIVYFALKILIKNVFNKGKLGNIPSIHMARWVIIDGGRRILFMSNFDNSWESYLGDFIDQASAGLTGVWSNTVGYPRTKWLIKAGSKDAFRFKAWTRHHQIKTQVWYSAYPNLSIRNVNANTEIRRGLADSSCMPASVWLDWLQGVDRADAEEIHENELKKPSLKGKTDEKLNSPLIDVSDVQGLIIWGYGSKKGTEFLMLKVLPGQATKAKQWISQLNLLHAGLSDEETKKIDPFLNIAFTYEGLNALELESSILEEFPIAFAQGSAHPIRARINGDNGTNAPENWYWGAGEKSVDVLLLIYGDTPESTKAQATIYKNLAEQNGLALVVNLTAGELSNRSEHFGFRDGIAQPDIKGTKKDQSKFNTLNPGEFLLGHENEYGNIAHSPGYKKGMSQNAGYKGFGFNGSYLVFRQLKQNVEAFWNYCSQQANELGTTGETIAAKMVGRWPSGAPLVKHPEKDPNPQGFSDDDKFSYLDNGAQNDRGGASCPFGAHIRRSNPRDWETGATRAESIALANRHRIMRRGRPYGKPLVDNMDTKEMAAKAKLNPDTSERGLHFLAFNADIERQFEFVQQQWASNPTFAGLNSSADAIMANQNNGISAHPTFTIQSDAKKGSFAQCTGLQQFVDTVGSAYFFMPSLSAVRKLAE